MKTAKDIKIFSIDNRLFLVSKKNGKVVRLLKPIDHETIYKLESSGFFDDKPLEINRQPKTITMSLNITNQCNLNCKYCFNKDKYSKQLTYEQCEEFINKLYLSNI